MIETLKLDVAANRKASNPERLSETKKITHQEVVHQQQQQRNEQQKCFTSCTNLSSYITVAIQFAWASLGNDTHYGDIHLGIARLVKITIIINDDCYLY